MESLFNAIANNAKKDFDTKEVSKLLIKIKFSNYTEVKNRMKYKLFLLSSKFLLKAINNFNKLIQNVPEDKKLHTNEDIASECYIIYDRCVENIKIDDISKYAYYLNTSLNRGIYRVYERNYKKNFNVIDDLEYNDIKITQTGFDDNNTYSLDDDLKRNFTNTEIEIINYKLSGEKIHIFLKRMKMTNFQLKEYMEIIKEKIIDLYINDIDITKFKYLIEETEEEE